MADRSVLKSISQAVYITARSTSLAGGSYTVICQKIVTSSSWGQRNLSFRVNKVEKKKQYNEILLNQAVLTGGL